MPRVLERAFVVFHWTLGVVVIIESLRTAIHASHGGHHPLVILAAVEALGAALFLWPPTLVLGAAAMLATFAIAFLVHAVHGDFNLALLVFAAGVALVLAQRRSVPADPSRA